MTAVYALLSANAFLSLVYWLWMLVGVLRVVRRVPILAKEEPSQPKRWPKLSVVIAARDEATTLEPALRRRLQQDYPDLQVVLVDDRSTGGTGHVADSMAEADSRVQVIHIGELPDGWLGKVHALAESVRCAGGEWLRLEVADDETAWRPERAGQRERADVRGVVSDFRRCGAGYGKGVCVRGVLQCPSHVAAFGACPAGGTGAIPSTRARCFGVS